MSVASLYTRGLGMIRDLPWLLALPLAAELLQHAAEIRLQMYAGPLDTHAQAVRLGFGALKVFTLFLTMLIALRWWRFGGDLRNTLRPSWRLAKGLMLLAGAWWWRAAGLGDWHHHPLGDRKSNATLSRLAMGLPLLGWLFVAGLVYPWYVALLTEDEAMSMRCSVAVMRGRLVRTFALLVAGYLPLMIVHYALGFGAMGRSGAIL